MIKQEKIKHNAQCLLGIDDEWNYSDIKEHLEWLIQNPNEIADGYCKGEMTEENVDRTMGWVLYYKQMYYANRALESLTPFSKQSVTN